jgi:hypothetical protein
MTRIEQIAGHLIKRGHISQGSALVEYGQFRLSDIIHRLRNERQDLLPAGHIIVTIHKQDTKGNSYGEYHLVSATSAAELSRVEAARRADDQRWGIAPAGGWPA